MALGRKVTRGLYKAARKTNDFTTLFSGSPSCIGKRVVNKWIGRNIARRFFLRLISPAGPLCAV